MKIGMKEYGRERAVIAADEICLANNLIAPRGGHSAEFPPRSYCNMIAGGSDEVLAMM